MATRTNSPQVAALLSEVEKTYGRPVRTPADFVLLADLIERETREHISDSTIKRLYKSSLSYDTVSDRTLNVISNYVGFPHFWAFTEHLAQMNAVESEMISGSESIKADDLIPGNIVRIAWQADRECVLKYLGERKFVVVTALNSKIQPGDTFFCSRFIKGRALYVDDLLHDGEAFERYAMGTQHGLTAVELEENN